MTFDIYQEFHSIISPWEKTDPMISQLFAKKCIKSRVIKEKINPWEKMEEVNPSTIRYWDWTESLPAILDIGFFEIGGNQNPRVFSPNHNADYFQFFYWTYTDPVSWYFLNNRFDNEVLFVCAVSERDHIYSIKCN